MVCVSLASLVNTETRNSHFRIDLPASCQWPIPTADATPSRFIPASHSMTNMAKEHAPDGYQHVLSDMSKTFSGGSVNDKKQT